MKKILLLALLIPAISLASVDKDLRQGMKGTEVIKLQNFLGIKPATGYFGSVTFVAVKKYQKENKLPATGFVGSMTRAKINTLSVAPVVSAIFVQPISTSTAPIEVVPEPAVYATPTISNPIVQINQNRYTVTTMEPVQNDPTIILEAPTLSYFRKGEVWLANIPVKIEGDLIKNGSTVVIDGVVKGEGDAKTRLGIVINSKTPAPYEIEANTVRGTYEYTIVVKDYRGFESFTTSGSIAISDNE